MIMLKKLILKPAILFPFNIALLLILVVIADKFILNSRFYHRAMNDSGLDWNTILLSTAPKFKMLLYTASTLLLFLKYTLIALLIYTTFYLNMLNVSYLSIFKIVCLAEMVFLVPAMIKVIWFIFYPPTGLDQWTQFYPLSIHSILYGTYIPAIIRYPLQLLNAFELIYLLVLAYLLQKLLKNEFNRMLNIVLISYLPGLSVWMLLTTYYTVMLQQS